MKKNKIKIGAILIIALSVILIGCNTFSFAHSGRTDANGGHKDNKNKSGLGSYHYHCGGHPAHLHINGVCPYSASSTSSNNSSNASSTSSQSKDSTTSSSSTSTVTTVPSTIAVTGIQINENLENLKVGESKTLTVTINPDNATDKTVTWKSSNVEIASITSTGLLLTKKSGTVDITATSSNGKTSTIKVNIEEQKEDNTVIASTSTNSENDANTDITDNSINTTNTSNTLDSQNASNTLGGTVLLGLLGAGGYFGYKKLKEKE